VIRSLDPALHGKPLASGEDRATHETHRPDAAVDAALITQSVGATRLCEQLVEALAVARRDAREDTLPRLFDVAVSIGSGNGTANRLHQQLWQLERARAANFEAVDQAALDHL
jgi:hypothetical protein